MFGIELAFPRIGFLQFWITLAIGFIVVVVFSIYIGLFVWYFGKTLRPYMTARFIPNCGIIQEYDRENMSLKLAHYKDGQFTPHIDKATAVYKTTPIVTKTKWEAIKSFFSKKTLPEPLNPPKPITAKSILSINGVRTLLGWNVTTKLPEQYLDAVKALLDLSYKSPVEIANDIRDKKLNPNSNIKGMTKFTYMDFLELHDEMVRKYTIIVTPNDVLNFTEKYLDEHPRKSIIEKEKAKEQKRLSENKYAKYAFLIIAIMVIGGLILRAYKIYKGG